MTEREYHITVTFSNARGEFEGDEELVETHHVLARSGYQALMALGAELGDVNVDSIVHISLD